MMLRTFLIVSLACLLLGSCGFKQEPKVEKVFPGGDPFPYGEAESGGRDPITVPTEPGETRRIIIPRDRVEVQGLRIQASVAERNVKAGNAVVVTLLVRNSSSMPITIPYPDEQRFDVVVFSDPEQNRPVHVYSEGRFFAQRFTEHVLMGGTTLTRIIEVPTTKDMEMAQDIGDLSKPLTPGKYWLYGTHEGQPFLASEPIEIEVVE